jgi:hypothetical protein
LLNAPSRITFLFCRRAILAFNWARDWGGISFRADTAVSRALDLRTLDRHPASCTFQGSIAVFASERAALSAAARVAPVEPRANSHGAQFGLLRRVLGSVGLCRLRSAQSCLEIGRPAMLAEKGSSASPWKSAFRYRLIVRRAAATVTKTPDETPDPSRRRARSQRRGVGNKGKPRRPQA